jgi:hypothetical protein
MGAIKCYARAEQGNGGEERLFDCLIHIHIPGLPSFCSRSESEFTNVATGLWPVNEPLD